ncbi:MAG: hypothetical protein ACYC0Q_06455 [Eubacteriales bacterium]
MTKQKKEEFSLTVSGFEYDKELSRVPIKVFPALQALIANQHDLIQVFQKYVPEESIFLEAHVAELADVEETIAKEHAKYCAKREEQKRKRVENRESINNAYQANGIGSLQEGYDEPAMEHEALLDEIAAAVSPGLPSSRFTPALAQPNPAKKEENDIRRIAVGASIKALSNLLGRNLTNQEILVIEKQVDSFVVSMSNVKTGG